MSVTDERINQVIPVSTTGTEADRPKRTEMRALLKEIRDAGNSVKGVWAPTLLTTQAVFETAVDVGIGSAPVISNGGKTVTGAGMAFSAALEEFLSYDYEAGIAFTMDLTSATEEAMPFGVWIGDSIDINSIEYMAGTQVKRENGSLFADIFGDNFQEIPPTATQFLLTVQRVSADVFFRLYTDVDPSTPLIQGAGGMPPKGLKAFVYYNELPSSATLLSKNETSFDYVDITDAGLVIDETDLPAEPSGNLYELSLTQDTRLSSLGRVVKDKDIVAFGQDGQPIQIIQEVNIPDIPSPPDLSGFATEEWVNNKGYALASDVLTKERWKVFDLVTASDDIFSLEKGVYRASLNNLPMNSPPLTYSIGNVGVIVVHNDPFIDSYLNRNLGAITVYGVEEIWEWLGSSTFPKWTKVYPLAIPEPPLTQADFAELDTQSPSYIKNRLVARGEISGRAFHLPSGAGTYTAPTIGGLILEESLNTYAKTLVWDVNYSDAFIRGYQLTVVTGPYDSLTLQITRDGGAAVQTQVLDANSVYVARVETLLGGGGSYSPKITKVSDFGAAKIAATVPSSATSAGKKGQAAHDSDYFYVCVATDTWKRVALATWS